MFPLNRETWFGSATGFGSSSRYGDSSSPLDVTSSNGWARHHLVRLVPIDDKGSSSPLTLILHEGESPRVVELGGTSRESRGSIGSQRTVPKTLPGDGPGLPGQRNPATLSGPGICAGGAPVEHPTEPLGVRPATVQETQRDRTAVPKTQRLTACLLPFRQT